MTNSKQRNQKRAQRKERTRAKILGTASKPRFSVFSSNSFMYAQLIDDEKGHTLASAKSEKPVEVGKIVAEKALKSGIKEAVFDRGFYKYHGRVKAVAEEARKAGLKI